ncbi:Transcriptional regulator, LysR family (fragment) [Paraburkholderia piptadeniae]|uniref:Transcriptional regulator, LysR family n=1 Tax=Paraburkholderia piptadeniae TaxID=1701573 RepID=A0A1N7SR21_9BURK
MQKIAGVFDRLSSGPVQQELVLAATSAFTHFRLLPRLASLKKAQPDLQLRISTQMFIADLRPKEIDVAVRFGNGQWGDGSATLLFDEEVFPVCSPEWVKSRGTPESLQEVANAALIESDATSEGWMRWEEWFLAVGFRPVRLNFALRCSLYTDAIEAARYGQGIALGWGRLVHDLIETGELVRLPVASFKASDSYYVVVPHGRTITPAIDGLIDWLRQDSIGT